MDNLCLYSLESESSPLRLIQVRKVDMKRGRDSPKVIPPLIEWQDRVTESAHCIT